METLSTSNVAVQTMICSLVLQTAQKSLLSLLFMIEFLNLYPGLVGVERTYRKILIVPALFIFLFVCLFGEYEKFIFDAQSFNRFPFGELKRATAPYNEPKDSSETENDDDENEDNEDADNDEEDDENEGDEDTDNHEARDDDNDDDEEDSDGDGESDDDSNDEDEDDDADDEDDEEEENNQPIYKKIK